MEGCEVHTFDPTIEEDAFIGKEFATFHMWGLGTDNGKEGNTMHGRKDKGTRKSFETLIKELGHENRIIDVLKVRHLMHPLIQLSTYDCSEMMFPSINCRSIVRDASTPLCLLYLT